MIKKVNESISKIIDPNKPDVSKYLQFFTKKNATKKRVNISISFYIIKYKFFF